MKFSHSWRRYRKAILALFFCTSLTAAQAVDFMPVNDVTTGMEGIAKTVIVGDTISTFDVKVLGVMKDKGPSGHLILAKFSGPVMEKTGGIAHGMSGSPVYINGKLVGAVAYGWGFADGTIGMITPIEDMVKLWNIPYEKNLSKPWDDKQLIPLGTPLMAYGFDAASMDYFKSKLPQYKYETYDTASASGDEIAKPLEAGGSVAALLVDGDLKLGAIGTVTYVDGEKIVAFGHPFLKHGSSNYFMHNASIFTVVKSYDAAFKLGSMGKEVGSVTEDRGAGIAGVSGVISPGIPMRFHLKDLDMGRDKTSSVKVIEDSEMTPTLAATSLYNMLNKTLDRSGAGTATISYTITPRGKEHKPLTRTNMFYSSDSISEKAVDEFYNVIDVLMNNRFINYEISDISVETEVTQDKKTAKLVDASASSTIVSPGDTIVVDVTLEPFRGEKVVKQIFFKVPEDQAVGKYTLEVRGGGEIPLPYVLEKQKYNLTEKDFRGELLKDFHKDQKGNNDILSLTKPEVIKEIHKSFLKAGADIIETNSFNSTSISQEDYGTENLVYDLNYNAAKIAREVADEFTKNNPNRPRFVAGSIGPTNKTASLSPHVENPGYRNVTFDSLVNAYKEQISALIYGGVDCLLIETVFDALNCRAAIVAANKVYEEKQVVLPIMISGTLTDKSGRTLSGQLLDAFAQSVRNENVISIGLNCSFGGADMIPFIKQLAHTEDVYISCYPNAGLPNVLGEYDELPKMTAGYIRELALEKDVNIVGGCCGTTPDHIKAIAEAVEGLEPRKIPKKKKKAFIVD